MNNYSLTDEIDDGEWTDNEPGASNGLIIGNGSLTTTGALALTSTSTYRCWLPR